MAKGLDKEFLRECLDDGMSLIEIGRLTGRPPGTVGYWVRRHGLVANGSTRFRPGKGLRREQLEPLVEAGMTLAQIAAKLDSTKTTVSYWAARHGLVLRSRADSERIRQARTDGQEAVTLECGLHGRTEFKVLRKSGARCKRCAAEAVVRRRRKVKRLLVAEAGGCCAICGYDRYPGALHFHHLDPAKKAFAISLGGVTRGIDAAREEMKKCILLCSNCHAEVEGGVTAVPLG